MHLSRECLASPSAAALPRNQFAATNSGPLKISNTNMLEIFERGYTHDERPLQGVHINRISFNTDPITIIFSSPVRGLEFQLNRAVPKILLVVNRTPQFQWEQSRSYLWNNKLIFGASVYWQPSDSCVRSIGIWKLRSSSVMILQFILIEKADKLVSYLYTTCITL